MFGKRFSIVTLAFAAASAPIASHAQASDWRDGYGWGYQDGSDDSYGHGWGDGYGAGWRDGYHTDREHHGWAREERRDRESYYDSEYDDQEPHTYADRPRRRICRSGDGTGGLVIGALAGGLLGREVARDRTAGALIGGGVGALAGRAIDKGRCR